ncbi:histidine kinase [Candidatus Marinamargulisbacteria bacterium SCGC AG-333-B06]|nr:histidine kinase [Candidatus Marinamargulisbacteria bacterium SCGC AG-333-B06]
MAARLEVSLKIPSMPEFVGVVRLAISGIAARMNFTIDEIEDIKISVSEACTNVIQHAYGSSPNPEEDIIEINAYIVDDNLEIYVKDYGQGFDLSIIGTPEQREKSKEKMGLGLGLTFIKSLMDDTNFESVEGKGTTIQMKKKSLNYSTTSVS